MSELPCMHTWAPQCHKACAGSIMGNLQKPTVLLSTGADMSPHIHECQHPSP